MATAHQYVAGKQNEKGAGERVEHREGVGRLVARHHVAGVEDAEEGEAVRRLQCARLLAADDLRRGRCGVEVAAVRPRQRLGPRLVAGQLQM